MDQFNPEGKMVLHLEVIDNPKRFPEKAQKLARKSWFKFQEKYVYSKLRKQIEQYMHLLKKPGK